MDDREQLERAIAAQEQLRGVVADEIVDLTVESLQRQLAALDSTDQRRRHATVLFADVHGFTRMASGLDAEVVTDVMNRLWDRLDGAITSFGGRIDKHLGDGVMALWGADAARENDPEQAVRAALAMQGALAEFNAASNHDLSMRVGITTGPVVLGEVASTREFTAMGDTVNVAARLESAAPLGGVLISHDTYRHVRGIFDVTPLAPITVKGKDEPLQTYSVLRSKPRAFRLPTRGVEGVATEMVGRQGELQALRDAFQTVSAGAGSQVVTVIGDAGVGKSRLLYEMESWIELRPEPVYYLKARALATRQDVPYGVFRDLLASRFEILDSDTPADLAEKLRRGFAPHLTGDQAELVGHWMGFDIGATDAVSRAAGATTLTSACVAHLSRFLRAVSADSSALLVVEDLHWADPASVELLGRLIDGLRESRVLVVGATRPIFIQEHPDWLATTPGASRLALDRLDDDATRALAREILRKLDTLPDALVELIADRADGNPFFVEELIKMFIDDGVIEVSDDQAWRLDLAQLGSTAVPTTLTGVLETRLDSLALHERRTLQRASVIGRVFWDDAVAALDESKTVASRATDALDVVARREFVYRRDRSAIEGSAEYIFKHALLRDVTYETVLLRDRQHLHELAAAWLTSHAGERQGEFLELIAEHQRLGGHAEVAAELLLRAAQRSAESAHAAMSRTVAERAIALWQSVDAPPPAAALLLVADSSQRMGDAAAARTALAAIAKVELSDAERAHSLFLQAFVAGSQDDRVTARALLHEALALSKTTSSWMHRRMLRDEAWYYTEDGDLDAGEAIARQIIELARPENDRFAASGALSLLAQISHMRGEHEVAVGHLDAALDIIAGSGDIESEAQVTSHLGVALHLIGDETGSIDHYERACELYHRAALQGLEIGITRIAAVSWCNLAQARLRLGDAEGCRDALRRAAPLIGLSEERFEPRLYVMVEADLRLTTGDAESGLELLGAVQSEPGLPASDRQEIDRILNRVGLSPERIAAGMEVGARRGFGDVAQSLLGGA